MKPNGKSRFLTISPAMAAEKIIDMIHDSLLLIDSEGMILRANDAACRLTGWDESDLQGRSFHSLFTLQENAGSVLDKVQRGIEICNEELTLEDREHKTVQVLLSASAIADQARERVGMVCIARDITERKEAEEELRKREEKYQDLYENSPDMYVSVDAKTAKIVRCNETTLKVLGYTREEVMGRSIFDMYAPESVNYAKKTVFPKFQQTGEIRDEELQVMRKDGSAIPVNLNASAVYDTDGEIIQSRSVWRDVTDYKLTAEALKESEAQFRGAFENAAVGAAMVDLRGRFLRVNRRLCEMTGYSVKELLSRTFSDITHPDDIQIGMDYLKKMVDGELDYASFRKRYLHKDGHVVHLNISPSIIRGEDGSPRHFVALFQDITERTRVENALRESEEHFREFVMAQADPLQVLDTAGTILICNDASAESHGSSVAELIGENAFDGMPAAVAAERRVLLDRVISTKQAIMIEEEVRGKLYETMLSPITNQSGEVVKIAIFPHDITRRKRAEEELRESETYNRNILDTVDEGFIVVDRDYRILTANRCYCEQVSLPSNEVLGKHCYEVSHRLERPCYELGEDCAVQKVFATGKPHSAVHKHPGKEGQVLYVETKAFPVTDRSGQVTSAIETVNNITEKHLLQEERLKTQKLKSIGTLAGGIAHDFNNLLQGVFGHISMARMSIDQKDKSLVMLEQAEKALHRTVSLTNQLLTFSKGGKPVKKPFPILPVVEDAVRFALSGSSSEYEVLPQGDLWLVDGDADQIGQVIQNITLNADQSMPQGGKISFRVRNIAADSEMPAVLKNGEYVMISIQDNGHGISEEFRERIFDPYFTTKERGSGLGLATSYSIVRNHDGIIVVESQLGKGATFRIYLPAVLEKIQEQKPASAPTDVRSAKVLIMDDEEIVRVVTGNLMRALGHECESAEEGESAVAIFKAARDGGRPFDLVLLDLTIRGGMGGAEAIRELLTIDPEVKAIVMSGYSNEDTLSEYQNWGFKMFLKKPFRIEELQRAVNSLLG